ncbi:unnamed protein product [Cochlearia groenlandica]
MSQKLTLVFLVYFVVINHLHASKSLIRNPSALTWCMASPSATDAQLQANIDWACNEGNVACVTIQPGGTCFDPNTLISHASFVMNAYYQRQGRAKEACDFSNTGKIVITDPSYGVCKY